MTTRSSRPSCSTALMTPIAEPSLAPKKPAMSGLAVEHAQCDVGRLLVLAGAEVGTDDLDVRVGLSHAVQEAIAAVDAGTAGRVVHDDADLAGPTDGLGHLVGRERGSSDVVGRGGGDRNVTLDAGVERDDGDVVSLELLERRQRSLAVERGEADRVRVLLVLGLEHVHLDL